MIKKGTLAAPFLLFGEIEAFFSWFLNAKSYIFLKHKRVYYYLRWLPKEFRCYYQVLLSFFSKNDIDIVIRLLMFCSHNSCSHSFFSGQLKKAIHEFVIFRLDPYFDPWLWLPYWSTTFLDPSSLTLFF